MMHGPINIRHKYSRATIILFHLYGRFSACNKHSSILFCFILYIPISGDRRSTVVKVLCYKSEGLWFDPSWCYWNFSWT